MKNTAVSQVPGKPKRRRAANAPEPATAVATGAAVGSAAAADPCIDTPVTAIAAQADMRASPAAAATGASTTTPRVAEPADPADPVVHLDHGLQVKDVEDVYGRLAEALNHGTPMTVDLSRVGLVDTAGVQLMLSLRGESVRRGIPVTLRGESAALDQALTLLGLSGAFQAMTSHD